MREMRGTVRTAESYTRERDRELREFLNYSLPRRALAESYYVGPCPMLYIPMQLPRHAWRDAVSTFTTSRQIRRGKSSTLAMPDVEGGDLETLFWSSDFLFCLFLNKTTNDQEETSRIKWQNP